MSRRECWASSVCQVDGGLEEAVLKIGVENVMEGSVQVWWEKTRDLRSKGALWQEDKERLDSDLGVRQIDIHPD